MFLAGLPHFRVITDHHPLIPILNSHRLDEIENPQLQRLKIESWPTISQQNGTKERRTTLRMLYHATPYSILSYKIHLLSAM